VLGDGDCRDGRYESSGEVVDCPGVIMGVLSLKNYSPSLQIRGGKGGKGKIGRRGGREEGVEFGVVEGRRY